MDSAKFCDKTLKYIHEMSVIGAIGGSIFDYFVDLGIHEVALYGNDELVPILYEQAFWLNIDVTYMFGLQETVFPVQFGVSNSEKSIRLKTTPPDKSLPVVLCETPKIRIQNSYHLFDLLSYSRTKNILFDKIINYKKQYAPKLDVVVLVLPSLAFTRNKNEHEKTLRTTPSAINMERSAETLRIMGKSEDYIKSVNRGANVIIKSGVSFLSDYSSDYCNYVGGKRLTTDIPANADKTIYTFGQSVCFGMKTDDEHTIQSVTQRALNIQFQNKCPYKIENCANGGHPNTDQMWKSFEYHRPSDKDVTVLVSYFSNLLYDKYKEDFIFIRPQIEDRLFDRPHELGEYVFLDQLHYSDIGYTALGNYLAKKLIEKNAVGLKKENTVQQTNDISVISITSKRKNEIPVELGNYLLEIKTAVPQIGSIVMNCNPFTLGHRYLIEESARKVANLIIFIVEEDKSIFSFTDRIELVRKGTKDLKNVYVVPSGGFIISQRTFDAYFKKDSEKDKKIDPSLDIEIFAQHIAPALGITVRFAGEEPLDKVTLQYNQAMSRILPKYGIEFKVIPRKESNGQVISASRVRKLLETESWNEIAELVPQTTLKYLQRN